MGKKPRAANMADSVEGRDARVVKRVMRRLGLVESHQSFEGWYAQVSGQLPEASMRELENNNRGSRIEYGLNYQDFDHARLLHVSWRSHALEMEIVWMLPRLREALTRVRPERRFLVELGAGHGAAAAVISAVMKVPVITVDPEPAALGLPEQFAARTGGDVTSIIAGAQDLPDAIGGRVPAAVFGMGVFRYFQTHKHETDTFSFMAVMDRMLDTRTPDAASLAFFESVTPAEILFSEMGCPDYLAEVLLGARAAGYDLAQNGASIKFVAVAGGQKQDLTLFHLINDPTLASDKHPFIEMHEPVPTLHAGLSVENASAEAIRMRYDQRITTQHCVETQYANGSLRREIFTIDEEFAGVYKSSSLGSRSIRITSHDQLSKLSLEALKEDTEVEKLSEVTILQMVVGASHW